MVKFISSNNLLTTLSILMGIFVFIPLKLKPVIVVFCIIFIFFNFKKNFDLKNYLFFYCYFFLVNITLIYCNNFDNGIKLTIRTLPILVIPYFFSILNDNEKKKLRDNFIKYFIFSNFIYSLLIWPYLAYVKATTTLKTLDHLLSYITYEFFGFNDHPIYISSFFAVSIIFLIFKENKNKTDYFMLFFLIITLVLLSRKMIIISLFVSILIYYIINRKINILKNVFFFILFFSIVFILYFIPEIYLRFIEVLNLNQNLLTSSSGIRLTIWKIVVEILYDNWLFGVSWGDVQDALNEKYSKYGFVEILNKNCHNQYLQILLASGVTGLIIISIFYFNFFKNNVINNKYFLLTQILFLSLFIVENYLERQNGILFFVIISCLFIKRM